MAHVSDFVNDVSAREREVVENALMEGENIRWATRPNPRLWCAESILMFVSAIPGLVFMCFWTHGVLGFPETTEELLKNLNNPMTLPFLLFSLIFWAVDIYFLAFPWLRRAGLRRSLCVLTTHRALVLECGLFSRSVRPFALAEDMVLESRSYAHGQGDLIFALEHRAGSKGHTRTIRHGFRELPNLQEAEQKLAEAIAERLI